MDFIFCPDFSREVGIGHLIRCLNLAIELKKKGAKIIFIVDENNISNFPIKLKTHFKLVTYKSLSDSKNKNNLEKISKKIKKIKSSLNAILIIDNYKINLNWEQKIKKYVKKIFVIDDFLKPHYCDFYLNQGNILKKNNLSKNLNNNYKLLGPKFSLLNKKNQIRKINFDKDFNKNILVSFGGSDRENLTFNIIKILKNNFFNNYKINVFLGPYNEQKKSISEILKYNKNFNIYNFSSNYVDFIKKSSLAIINGGVSVWENICHGVPSLVFQISKNQKIQTDYLKRIKVIAMIDLNKKKLFPKHEILKKIIKLTKNNSIQKKNILKGQSLVDGYGALRVAEILYPSNSKFLRIHKANINDCLIYYNWFNDPINIKNSIIKKKTDISKHIIWFKKKISNKLSDLLILKIGNLPIGQIRFEKKVKYILIDYYLDEIVRKRGWGKKLLYLGLKKMNFNNNILLRGQVRKNNHPSIKVFLKLGFKLVKKDNNFIFFEIESNKINYN